MDVYPLKLAIQGIEQPFISPISLPPYFSIGEQKKMNGKRSDLAISAAILKVALNGAKKSHIVYKANLNFQLGNKYLDRLTSSGLIRRDSLRDFWTTDKGVEYVNYFEGLRHYLS